MQPIPVLRRALPALMPLFAVWPGVALAQPPASSPVVSGAAAPQSNASPNLQDATAAASSSGDPRADASSRGGTRDERLEALEAELRALREQLTALGARLGTTAAPSVVAVPSSAASTAALVEELDQRLRVLERKLEIEREQAAERTSQTPVVVAGAQGFQLRSADGAFLVRFRGYLHADGRLYADDGVDLQRIGVLEPNSSFVIRRARPVLEATLFNNYDIRIMPDFGAGLTTLQDAYLDARFSPKASLRVGKYKAPFGLERLVSATDLLFVERALPTQLVPNRDIGLTLHGEVASSRVSYQAGVFNGVIDGSSLDLDDREGKDVVGRVMMHPFRGTPHERWESLGLGVAGSFGSQRGTPAVPNLTVLRTAGQQIFFRYRTDLTAAGTTVADGDHWRMSAQGYHYVGRLGLLGEYVWSTQEVRRATEAADLTNQAWQLATSWVLTGETPSYRAIQPKRVFDAGRGTWGAIELTARANGLRVDRSSFPVFANPDAAAQGALGWAAGVNWYLNRAVKFTLNYEETHFDGGTAAGDRPVERDVLSRFQVAF